jgi:glycosyltransferase involved in cell wall biosynthesis
MDRVEHRVIRRRRLWTHSGFGPAVWREPPDVLFVPAHVLPLGHPAASVVTIHDLGYRHERQSHTARRRLVLEATTRWNARRATRVITPSRSTARDIEESYGVERDRIDVIYHGLDHARFRELPDSEVEPVLERLGIRRPYLLFLSTVQPRKNVSRLVSAFEALEREDLTLVVAGGDGWMSASINQRIARSTRAASIIRLGYVTNADVPALYNGAAAFVLPSLYEGFGMGVIEAMACGCPVVTSSASSLPEVASGAALIVDPTSVESIRDGIATALQTDQSRRLKNAGLRRARHFTWERAALETLATIRAAYAATQRAES